jgi:hypothetical protein
MLQFDDTLQYGDDIAEMSILIPEILVMKIHWFVRNFI